MSITIGKLSQATAVNVETIRYYERIGLLAAPLRTSSGYRSYTAQDVARLRFIKRGRELGFSLEEIRTLVELADQPGHACSDVDRLVQTHLVEVRQRIADLQRYSISTFQRARHLLGPEFQAMAEANPHYREEAQQINRNRLLYSGRIDVAVGDPRILRYFNREVARQVDTTQPVTQYLLFPPSAYSVGFRLREQRERFDRGLAAIRASGEYLRIEQRYAD